MSIKSVVQENLTRMKTIYLLFELTVTCKLKNGSSGYIIIKVKNRPIFTFL